MPSKNREDLYDLFATGNKPTSDDFADLIDSMINIAEDGLGISEKGEPLELIEQGEKKRLLDFSSSKDTPVWRINALSADAKRSGLHISSNNVSRLFIKKDNGFTGINNDAPAAKLHITPDSGGPALQIDNVAQNPALLIEENGAITLGSNSQDSQILTVNGAVGLNGHVEVDGGLSALQGLRVVGAILQAEQGMAVKNGATVESGLKVKDGLIVNGAVLTANAGAVVNGLALQANQGLIVNQGATIATGILEADAGLTVNGALLAVNAGAVVSGAPLTVNNGLTVSDGATTINGELLANGGLTVNSRTLQANGPVALGNTDSGNVTTNGELIAKNGISVQESLLKAESGAIVSGGNLNVANQLIVNGELQANGPVILGAPANGDIEVKGVLRATKGIVVQAAALQAEAGATVTGAELQANNGLTVQNGANIENGLLTVQEGLAVINGSTLSANGVVNLGNANNGVVIVSGVLRANQGGSVSGSELAVQNGLSVTGTVNALDEVNLGTTTIESLNVSNINITGEIGLTSVELTALNTAYAQIEAEMTADGALNVYGNCQVTNNIVLAGGKLYATYEGMDSVSPKIVISEGTVTGGTGHFDMAIDANKQVIISYDAASDLTNFISDWKTYQKSHAAEANGFDFWQVGTGSWKIKAQTIVLNSAGTAFQEYRIINNGLRVIYTGTQSGAHSLAIRENDDQYYHKFDFLITGSYFVIIYPNNSEYQTVGKLLADWANWKNNNQDLAADFAIQQSGDQDWQLEDILVAQDFSLSANESTKEYITKTKGVDIIKILYSGSLADTPKLIMKPNSIDSFEISISAAKVMTIKYPADKSGTVDDLLAVWEGLGPANQADFSILKYDITNAVVTETSHDLAVNPENKILYQGMIRTNVVTIDGDLKFGDSSTTISTISNSDFLTENSDAILATQKAVKTYVDNGLAIKADQTTVTSELAKKADATTVTTELAKKADTATMTTELAKKADTATMTNELAKKADATTVTTELAKKADTTTVTTELAKKADTTTMTTELALKADQATVTSKLAQKADQSAMLTALAAKAGLVQANDLPVAAGATGAISEIALTADSRGVLLARIITAAGTATAGLFALHGTESILKIAGDGMTAQKDNTGTCNLYLDSGAITVQNALAEAVAVTVSYIGV